MNINSCLNIFILNYLPNWLKLDMGNIQYGENGECEKENMYTYVCI